MTAYRFLALKIFQLKCYLIFKKKLVTRYCQLRHSDVLINSNLYCL